MIWEASLCLITTREAAEMRVASPLLGHKDGQDGAPQLKGQYLSGILYEIVLCCIGLL
jgi:hypothetical protein